MRITARNSLNWLIIAMMVLLPLRGVIASMQSSCDMHQHEAQAMHEHAMHDHAMHVMHHADEGVQQDKAGLADCCCCDSDMQCTADCGIGSNASAVGQSAIPVLSLNGAVHHSQVNTNLIFRALAPPIRPPAYLRT